MNRLIPLLAAALLATTGCAPADDTPALGTARLPLYDALLGAADLITIHARQDGELTPVWRFPDPEAPDAPAPAAALFDLPIGDYDALVLHGEIAGRPLYLGESAAFRVEGGAEVEVEVVIDPYGRLTVLPIGLPELLGVSVSARPLDPLPGDPERYALTAAADGFTGDLPIGDYAIELDLGVDLIGYVTADPLEVRVVEGQAVELRIAFGMLVPPLLPAVVDRLDLIVGNGGLLGGFSLTVTALDADGRRVPGYDGLIVFDTLGLDLGLLSVELPRPYLFVPDEDAGSHTFDAGLLVNLLGLATVRFDVMVEDADNGLRISAPVCVQGVLGRCP